MPDPLSLQSCRAAVIEAPLRCCAACGHNLYFGTARGTKKRTSKRKAVSVGNRKRAELWKIKGVVLKQTHNLCRRCHDADPYQLRIRRDHIRWTHIQIPEFIKNEVQQQRKSAVKNWERLQQPQQRRRHSHDGPITIEALNEKQIKYLSGLTSDNLDDIINHVNHRKRSSWKFKKSDLFIACSIWKHNLPYRLAAVLYGYRGHSGIKRVVDRVVDNLTRYWVKDHVGYGYWKDRNVSDHVPEFCKKLHPNSNVIGVADATYLYSQKSQRNYQYQKVHTLQS